MNNRGQLGTTLTWIPAFLIIFFMMLIFVGISASIAGQKLLPVVGEGKSEIEIEESFGDLRTQKFLVAILQFENEKGESLKELIVKWHSDKSKENKDVAENFIREILDEWGESYLFRADQPTVPSGSKALLHVSKNAPQGGPGVEPYLPGLATLNLLAGGEKIKLELYIENE